MASIKEKNKAFVDNVLFLKGKNNTNGSDTSIINQLLLTSLYRVEFSFRRQKNDNYKKLYSHFAYNKDLGSVEGYYKFIDYLQSNIISVGLPDNGAEFQSQYFGQKRDFTFTKWNEGETELAFIESNSLFFRNFCQNFQLFAIPDTKYAMDIFKQYRKVFYYFDYCFDLLVYPIAQDYTSKVVYKFEDACFQYHSAQDFNITVEADLPLLTAKIVFKDYGVDKFLTESDNN